MTSPAGLLEPQAILILRMFAATVMPAKAIGISQKFCDLTGVLPGGTVIGVKLRSSFHPLNSQGEAEERYRSEIRLMRCCARVRALRMELWIFVCGRSWQFFEITKQGIHQVDHAG